jgi:hypothetical protein
LPFNIFSWCHIIGSIQFFAVFTTIILTSGHTQLAIYVLVWTVFRIRQTCWQAPSE